MPVELKVEQAQKGYAVEISGSATITATTDLVLSVPDGKHWLIKSTVFTPGANLTFGQMKVDGKVIATSSADATITDTEAKYGSLIPVRKEIRITGTGSTSDSTLKVYGFEMDAVL